MIEEKKDFGATVYVASGTPEDREKRSDDAIKRFKRRVERYKILDEVKERQYYIKPYLEKKVKRKK